MAELSSADHQQSPPQVQIPLQYNAAHDLIARNLQAGRADKAAFIDDHTSLTYAQLAARVDHFAQALRAAGLRREERILLCMHDTVDWPVAFLGAIKAGVVPVAMNTLLRPADYAFMVADSRARLAFVSTPLLDHFDGLTDSIESLDQIVPVGAGPAASNPGSAFLPPADASLSGQPFAPAATCADEPCFWLYSSGSTGQPKGTVHLHASLMQSAELYGVGVLGITASDVVFSAAKLFFAYGLGNGLTFPLAVGATALLMAERPTPTTVRERLQGEHAPTIFYGVPTLYAAMLSVLKGEDKVPTNLRACVSAGEALPEEVGRRFAARFGVDILDGIGSTEMLHIFLSNRPGRVRYGTTGEPVPGYQLRLVNEHGDEVADGEIGDLLINGPSAASMYWNQRDKSRATFEGEWTRSGDKYQRSADGYYTYAGRSDDMLKVSGQYVSPFEVESALSSHETVLEAAVVGLADDVGLIKPKAFVVLQEGVSADEKLALTLKEHVKTRLSPYKYPRWIEFVDELPKTATGKIQRFKLRA